jgi:hypothetical protein
VGFEKFGGTSQSCHHHHHHHRVPPRRKFYLKVGDGGDSPFDKNGRNTKMKAERKKKVRHAHGDQIIVG